jgi:two-component system chemotaxis sensor kinase CheA
VQEAEKKEEVVQEADFEEIFMEELIEAFMEEAEDLFASAESTLLEGETAGTISDEDMNSLFRDVHTLKGSGAGVGLIFFPKYVHEVEAFMDKLRKKELIFEINMIDPLLSAIDIMKTLLEEEKGGDINDSSFENITVDTMNIFLEYLGKPLIIPTKKDQIIDEAKAEEPKKKKDTSIQSSIRVNPSKIDDLMNGMGNLVIINSMLTDLVLSQQSSAEEVDPSVYVEKLEMLEREIRNLQEGIMQIRMVPMETIYNKFPKLIRDISKKLGKQINFNHHGDSVEIDKATIEGLTDPLMHIIRNSLDHGIELPQKRKSSGKAEAGTVTIKAEASNGQIIIGIIDDGAGINHEVVSKKAVENGVITEEEREKMTTNEKAMLIFAAGLSTAQEVTDISGRGVGMDVVKNNIERLGGKISIQTEIGKGTEITITLPLTLAILDGLNVRVGKDIFIIPLSILAESLQPTNDIIKNIGSGDIKFLQKNEEFIPIIELGEKFGIENSIKNYEEGIILILNDGKDKLAVFVDEFLNQQQFVVKPLDKNLLNIKGFSGATIKGDGKISLILNPYDLATDVALKIITDDEI